MHGVTLDAAVAKSSLRARRSPTRAPIRPAAPPEPIGSLLPVFATVPRGAPTRLAPTELAALLPPFPELAPGVTVVRGGDNAVGTVLAWVAGHHVLAGRAVLWHTCWDRRIAARRLAAAMLGQHGAVDPGRPSMSSAGAVLGVTALFVSDDPATPVAELPNMAARIEPDVVICRRDRSARDASGALLGWRLWQVKGDETNARLVSPVQGVEWPRGVATATCGSCVHPAGHACACGLYAFNNVFDALAEWSESRRLVLGEVRGWGHAVLHEHGFRCEHAQILRLVAPAIDPLVRRALADRYECAVSP